MACNCEECTARRRSMGQHKPPEERTASETMAFMRHKAAMVREILDDARQGGTVYRTLAMIVSGGRTVEELCADATVELCKAADHLRRLRHMEPRQEIVAEERQALRAARFELN